MMTLRMMNSTPGGGPSSRWTTTTTRTRTTVIQGLFLLLIPFLLATTTNAFGIIHHQALHRPSFSSSSMSPLQASRGMGMAAEKANNKKGGAGVTKSSSSSGGGMGMGGGGGMGKNTNKKKKSKKKVSGGGGGSTTKNNSNNFDASASLIRLEKRYDELQLEEAKQLAQESNDEEEEEEDPRWASDTTTTNDDENKNLPPSKLFSEYIIAVRGATTTTTTTTSNNRNNSGGTTAVADWIPVGHLCVSRPIVSEDHSTRHDDSDSLSVTVRAAAISTYCRELSYVASLGAKVFSTVARNELQYSVEPVDSFYKFVYEGVVNSGSGKKTKSTDDASSSSSKMMTKSQARTILGLEEGGNYDKTEIKQAYRRLSFQYHPDRLVVVDNNTNNEDVEGTATQTSTIMDPVTTTTITFEQIKSAYETLSSGIRGADGISWYESLGGKDRTEFCGPVNLLSRDIALETLTRHEVSCGVVGLDPTIVQSFVARNLRSV